MKKSRILVVEDAGFMLKALKMQLEASGYEVIPAADGEEGLRKAREEHPDLIVLDLMLPKIDGYKVCRLIKFDEQYEHIPIIMVTAKNEAQSKNLGQEVGADAYLTKPYNLKQLLSTIEKLLNKTYIPDDLYLLLKRAQFKKPV